MADQISAMWGGQGIPRYELKYVIRKVRVLYQWGKTVNKIPKAVRKENQAQLKKAKQLFDVALCQCKVMVSDECQARIQGVGAGAGAHPWSGVSSFKMHYSTSFKYQFITGRPPLGEILYPPLNALVRSLTKSLGKNGSFSKISAARGY